MARHGRYLLQSSTGKNFEKTRPSKDKDGMVAQRGQGNFQASKDDN